MHGLLANLETEGGAKWQGAKRLVFETTMKQITKIHTISKWQGKIYFAFGILWCEIWKITFPKELFIKIIIIGKKT